MATSSSDDNGGETAALDLASLFAVTGRTSSNRSNRSNSGSSSSSSSGDDSCTSSLSGFPAAPPSTPVTPVGMITGAGKCDGGEDEEEEEDEDEVDAIQLSTPQDAPTHNWSTPVMQQQQHVPSMQSPRQHRQHMRMQSQSPPLSTSLPPSPPLSALPPGVYCTTTVTTASSMVPAVDKRQLLHKHSSSMSSSSSSSSPSFSASVSSGRSITAVASSVEDDISSHHGSLGMSSDGSNGSNSNNSYNSSNGSGGRSKWHPLCHPPSLLQQLHEQQHPGRAPILLTTATATVYSPHHHHQATHSAGSVSSATTTGSDSSSTAAALAVVASYAAAQAHAANTAAHATHQHLGLHPSLLHFHHAQQRLPSSILYPSLPSSVVVLQDDCLLTEVLSFLLGQNGTDRPTLSAFGLVSRRWRELSLLDRFWGHIARSCFPVLALEAASGESRLAVVGGASSMRAAALKAATGGSGRRGGLLPSTPHRDVVLDYGRCLVETRLCKLADWKEGLRLSFEVFDAVDDLRLYSAEGPVKVTPITDSNVTSLRLSTSSRREVTHPFSAASRDAGAQRFGSVRDYFRHGHTTEYPCALTVRITAYDVRTGRVALIYHASKAPKSSAGATPSAYWQNFLPPGSLDVCDAWAWNSVHHPFMGPASAGPAMEMRVGFFVGPEPGQSEGVSDKDRLYRVVARDWHPEEAQQDASLMFLYFKSLDTLAIGKFVRGLLDG